MFSEAFLNRFPKPTHKQMAKSRKCGLKRTMRAIKFSRRPGCYVVLTGNVKCLDCGFENHGHRLGCSQCKLEDMKKGVVYGAFLNTGKMQNDNGPLMKQNEFITYTDLLKRIKAGDRFYDLSSRMELTVKNFEPSKNK